MTIKRTTNYIEFISGLRVGSVYAGDKVIARKHNSKWLISRTYSDEPLGRCPIGTLRILIETGSMIEQKHIDYKLSDLLRYGF